MGIFKSLQKINAGKVSKYIREKYNSTWSGLLHMRKNNNFDQLRKLENLRYITSSFFIVEDSPAVSDVK